MKPLLSSWYGSTHPQTGVQKNSIFCLKADQAEINNSDLIIHVHPSMVFTVRYQTLSKKRGKAKKELALFFENDYLTFGHNLCSALIFLETVLSVQPRLWGWMDTVVPKTREKNQAEVRRRNRPATVSFLDVVWFSQSEHLLKPTFDRSFLAFCLILTLPFFLSVSFKSPLSFSFSWINERARREGKQQTNKKTKNTFNHRTNSSERQHLA